MGQTKPSVAFFRVRSRKQINIKMSLITCCIQSWVEFLVSFSKCGLCETFTWICIHSDITLFEAKGKNSKVMWGCLCVLTLGKCKLNHFSNFWLYMCANKPRVHPCIAQKASWSHNILALHVFRICISWH